MTLPTHNAPLLTELDQTMASLTVFDVQALEAMQRRIHLVTTRQLTASRESLPELLKKRDLLEQLLEATAANLKVLVSVLNLEVRTETR